MNYNLQIILNAFKYTDYQWSLRGALKVRFFLRKLLGTWYGPVGTRCLCF